MLQIPAYLFGQTTFKKRFGTATIDRAWCVEVLPDNSFIVGGEITGGGFGIEDAALVKFSATGDIVWSRVYGGSGFDRFFKVMACSDGNFLALGETNSMGAGNVDLYAVKFDGSGNVQWERTCGGSANENARGICEVADGYVITGNTTSFGNGASDLFVEKLSFAGNSMWCKAYGTAENNFGGEPIAGSNGQIWVAGYTNFGNNTDGTLLRLDANGNVVQARRIGEANTEAMYYLTPGGPGFIGSGSVWVPQNYPWMLGFNPAGNLLWAKRYFLSGTSSRANIEDCPNGGFIFTISKDGADDPNVYLVRTDDNGNISWAKTHSIEGTGRMIQARPAPDGGFVVVGFCNNAAQDLFILKTDADGNVEGCCPMDAPVTAEAIFPSTATISTPGVNGPAAATPTADNQATTLDETILCNGSGCCETDAGTMLEQTLHACINEPATLTHNGDEMLDGNDLLQFILFSDPNDTLGSIIAISNTPTFTFNSATMQIGVTYYVAAIAGNNVGGNVDFDDPCFDISDNAAELIWHPLPEVELQTDTSDVCPGDCHTLTAVLTGTPPFTLTITSPAGTTTVTIGATTGTFQICLPPGTPPGSFTVQATALADAYCTCP